MVQALRSQSRRGGPATAELNPRAIAIRDHVVPLIRMLAGAQRAGGLPVLIAVLGPYTCTYRRPLVGERGRPHHLEIRRRRRLMVLEWNEGGTRLLLFHPGPWQDEALRLEAAPG
jgi:hypothetical protein